LMNDIADSLNNRPRKVLGFMTPAEKMVELLTASIAPID
jgi:IS30 family transposase